MTSSSCAVQRSVGQADVGHVLDHLRATWSGEPWCRLTFTLGKRLAQRATGSGQEVARLAVRGGDRQRAGVLFENLADALEVGDLAHDDLDRLEHLRPGSVTRRRRLPWRAKMSTPSSSSSSRMALRCPGCEVNSALAVSVRFRLRRTASWTKRNWCRFMRLSAAVRCGESQRAARRAIAAITASSSPMVVRRSSHSHGGGAAANLDQQRQIAHVCAGAEEQRHDVDARAAGGGERIARQVDAGCHQIEVGERHRHLGRSRGSARRRPRRAAPSSGRARHGRTGAGRRGGEASISGSAPASWKAASDSSRNRRARRRGGDPGRPVAQQAEVAGPRC